MYCPILDRECPYDALTSRAVCNPCPRDYDEEGDGEVTLYESSLGYNPFD